MKISLQWLREWVDAELEPKALGSALTMAGFELESIAPAAPPFAGVRVAEIVSAAQHPQADKLRVCEVSLGEGGALLQIVCGAPNARAGLKTALATVGAQLPGDLKIKAAKLRGVESAGMLCSAKELGLSEISEGIIELPADASVGADLREYLALDDTVLELAVTPNRGDAMSMRGVAREVAALASKSLVSPDTTPVPASRGERPNIVLGAPAACPRFHARIIVDVDNTGASPIWLRERLRRAGVRSISPVVDITNYIVQELGQPMHAYDLDKVQGGLTARLARAGEHCELLDGRIVELQADMLVIADEAGPVALAGVMGGARTAVSAETRRVLFEVAWFAPSAIAGRGRRFGLTTDASQRFERGVDPEIGALAIERATRLLQSVAGGQAGPVVTVEETAHLKRYPAVSLRVPQIARLLGLSVSADEATALLQRLGILRQSVGRESSGGETLRFVSPSHRFDLSIERDLIEEIARLVGFEQIPTRPAQVAQVIQPLASAAATEQRLLDTLAARGYHEAIHFAFVEPGFQSALFPDVAAHTLSNPISSDLAVMRLSLWPGLIKAAMENQRRQQPRLRLMEHGVVFPVGAPESDRIAGLAMGPRWPEQWGGGREPVEFFDVRADVAALLSLAAPTQNIRFEAAVSRCLHPGRSARIVRGDQPIGWIGELHPEHVRRLEFVSAPILFELEVEVAFAPARQTFAEPSRYPQVRRDLAFVVDEDVSYADIRERVLSASSSALREVVLFDIYRGPGIEEGRKSVALGLILQDKGRTLTDEGTDRLIESVKGSLVAGLRATFRE
ncbi:MAG: phenylalanine--tRNA ligase subunit beta [Gammaproteobacteria bacterium]|nr:phenylalanine--tRNA ligase subunit beta [Gammaproteobacteria bacterium]